MNIHDMTLGDVVRKDYRSARLLERYKLDFCCGGRQKFTDACREKGLHAEEIAAELETLHSIPDTSIRCEDWSLAFLADYIVNIHHSYVRECIRVLLPRLDKVGNAHGQRFPELSEVRDIFSAMAGELQQHMDREEQVLFPRIRALESQALHYGPALRNIIGVMEQEHAMEGKRMHRLMKLTQDFAVPPGACNTLRVAYAELAAFCRDLQRHIHLENNILFPKALAYETGLV